jgi:hypothetical protein
MTDTAASRLAELLAEGLDLCVRARKLDEQAERALEVSMGRIFPEGTRCATPALWVQALYEKDLARWESRAQKALSDLGFM